MATPDRIVLRGFVRCLIGIVVLAWGIGTARAEDPKRPGVHPPALRAVSGNGLRTPPKGRLTGVNGGLPSTHAEDAALLGELRNLANRVDPLPVDSRAFDRDLRGARRETDKWNRAQGGTGQRIAPLNLVKTDHDVRRDVAFGRARPPLASSAMVVHDPEYADLIGRGLMRAPIVPRKHLFDDKAETAKDLIDRRLARPPAAIRSQLHDPHVQGLIGAGYLQPARAPAWKQMDNPETLRLIEAGLMRRPVAPGHLMHEPSVQTLIDKGLALPARPSNAGGDDAKVLQLAPRGPRPERKQDTSTRLH